MSDAEAFLGSYREALQRQVAAAGWPSELTAVYGFESCLKHSGAKEVYLVVDQRTGGPVVLRASDLDAGERADIEHDILMRLDFPGIPKSYGTFMKDGRSYLAREYFTGEPLDQVIARGVMQTAQIYSIARQLCAILNYLHTRQPPVIHRDIKPQNIILRPDGSLGLTDFGIARIYKEGSDSDTQYAGTMPYAPPEQYGYAQSSAQADIYALGIVLIYLATGSPNRQDLGKRIPDSGVRSLIERCIAFDPKNRFQNVGQVVRRIDANQGRRRQWVLGIAAVALTLALVGLGMWRLVDLAPNSPASEQGGKSARILDIITLLMDVDEGAVDSGIAGTDTDTGASLPGAALASAPEGNLTGNISNGGFAVVGDGVVYVASSDGIYEMSPGGALLRQIDRTTDAASLNYYQGKLYFTSYAQGLVCCNLADGSQTVLTSDPSARAFIADDRIYYENALDGLAIYVMDKDGSNKRRIAAVSCYYSVVAGGYHYFANRDDGERLYRTDLATGETQRLYDERSAWIASYNNRLYFSDFSIPGALMGANEDGTQAQTLQAGACSWLVAAPGGLVFVDGNSDLVRTGLEGGATTRLTSNKAKGHCVVGDWVIYRNADDEGALWIVRIDGSNDHRLEFG